MTGLVPMNLSDPVRIDTMVELGRRGVPYSVEDGSLSVPQGYAQTAGMIAGGVALKREVSEEEETGLLPDGSYASDVRIGESHARAAVRRSGESIKVGGRPELLRGGRKAGFGLYRDTRKFLEDPHAYGAIMLEQPEPPTVEAPHDVHYKREAEDPEAFYDGFFRGARQNDLFSGNPGTDSCEEDNFDRGPAGPIDEEDLIQPEEIPYDALDNMIGDGEATELEDTADRLARME